uniref:Uncharacterized protein n=1 Tax=viral metagenome TaxID=1070528 RepID=A0A6C0DFC3_9ZZZZ
MEEDKQEQKEQDKAVDVSLEAEKVEKEEVTKCCGSTDCDKKGCDNCRRCWRLSFDRIRGFFTGFSLGCSSTSCVALHTKKTVAQKVEEKKEEVPGEKQDNVV